MCGICGALNFDLENYVDSLEIKEMTRSLIHRGPDSEGFHMDKIWVLDFVG